MGIYRWSDDVILVDLPEALDQRRELQSVLAMLRSRRACACQAVVGPPLGS